MFRLICFDKFSKNIVDRLNVPETPCIQNFMVIHGAVRDSDYCFFKSIRLTFWKPEIFRTQIVLIVITYVKTWYFSSTSVAISLQIIMYLWKLCTRIVSKWTKQVACVKKRSQSYHNYVRMLTDDDKCVSGTLGTSHE